MKSLNLCYLNSLKSGLLFDLNACGKDESLELSNIGTPTKTTFTVSPSISALTSLSANEVLLAPNSISILSFALVKYINHVSGILVAFFYNNPGTYLVANSTLCICNALTKQTNNTYTFTPSNSFAKDIEYNSSVNWSIIGNSVNSVPNFIYIPTMGFAELNINAGNISNLTKSSGITIATANPITNAESVIFSVFRPIGNAQKVKNVVTIIHTYKVTDISKIVYCFMQIASYKIANQTCIGKKYYAINEAVFNKRLTSTNLKSSPTHCNLQ